MGVGGPVISQLLFFFHVVSSLSSVLTPTSPHDLHALETRPLQCIVVQGRTGSTELATAFRIPISALLGSPTPGTKFSGQRY